MKIFLSIFTSIAFMVTGHTQVVDGGAPTSVGKAQPQVEKSAPVPANIDIPVAPVVPVRAAQPIVPQGLKTASARRIIPKMDANSGPMAMAAKTGEIIDGSNWDDQDVADEYSKYTGQRVLLSSATQDLEIRFFQRGPLTNQQAASLLVKVLGMEGYVFVPSGVNEVKLLPKAQGSGANGPAELEDIIDDASKIPEGDDYISYFMKLNFIKPEEAVRTFTQSIHGLGPGAKIAAVPNASAILITGKSTFVRKLINQQRYIDVPTGNVATAWVELKYADSEDIAATLNEIMNAQKQSDTTAGVTKVGAAQPKPGVPAPVVNAPVSTAGEDIPVQIVPDPRLNKIFIMGRPVDIVFVEGLVRQFDAAPNRNSFYKRKLRFVIASDFLQIAADALEAHNGSNSNSPNRQGNARPNQQRNQSSRSTNNNDRGSSRSGNVESVEEFNVSDVPESIVVGKTFIVADNLANSILVQGPPESVRIVTELVDKLDGRPQQVMISTVFGEASLGNGTDIGVSLGAIARGGDRDVAGSTGGVGPLIDFEGGGSGSSSVSSILNVAGLNAAAV
ncbi:MAG: secretin N-terminal domain-containing protein, partial [Akkermansiaceae bacterium]|nr:secretin N-terminal domain-containing protein [Akkermansiaceae bacterium]